MVDIGGPVIALQELIKPTWSVEKTLHKAWLILTDNEKELIQKRVEEVFYNEIPFELKHDKIIYLHLFSMFAQLELIGLKGFILTLDKLEGPLYQQMREQITDEVFHAIIFVKLTYKFSDPYSSPPPYQKGFERFMSSFENEPDLPTALTLIGLIAEGWIEELFLAMKENNIAQNIFEVILKDEGRHIDQYDLYKAVGKPSKEYLCKKLSFFEQSLISNFFSQDHYIITLLSLLGRDKAIKILTDIDKKQHQMLEKIKLVPTESWQFFMKSIPMVIRSVTYDHAQDTSLKQTPMRRILSSLWSDPELPTQSSVFSIDVSSLCFFEKKFSPETLTCLMLQTLSKAIYDVPMLRNYMTNHHLYHPDSAYVGLAVMLPGTDAIGSIEFKNCHEMSLKDLAKHIEHDLAIMHYCYTKIETLKKEHPFLEDTFNRLTMPLSEQVYRNPMFAIPAISLSNVGSYGYEIAVSPLFPNEAVKLTLGKVERKQIWNKNTNAFEAQDILPVGLSVDHRVFDGNVPVPHYMQKAFIEMFDQMEQNKKTFNKGPFSELKQFIQLSDKMLENNLDLGVLYLTAHSLIFKNYHGFGELEAHLISGADEVFA